MAPEKGACRAERGATAAQIVVASKFDNRLKEFGERWEVDRYLSAAGYLSANVRPFFVALPKVGCPLPACSYLSL